MPGKKTRDNLNLILVQVRKDQRMKLHEITCFETSGRISDERVVSHDLLERPLDVGRIAAFDGIIIGGSGDYSVLDEIPNLKSLSEFILEAKVRDLPVISSCWGAQFLAETFGGKVIRDPEHREIGSVEVVRSDAAMDDPLFRDMPEKFWVQSGHVDRISVLPEGAVLLAGSPACAIQAFTFPKSGMYGIQFHPELGRDDVRLRLEYYKENYLSDADSVDEIIRGLRETEEAASLVGKWIDRIVLGRR